MTPVLLAGALLWGSLSPLADDRSVVVLAVSSDTGFILPLESASRDGSVWRGELIEIFALGEEPYDTARRESVLEINCDTAQFRALSVRSIDRTEVVKSSDETPAEWEPLELSFPPFFYLHAVACENAKVGEFAVGFSDAVADIRTSIQRH